jgi:hypothetical protein
MMKKILSLLLTILLLLSSMLFVPACTDRDSAQDGTQSNISEEPTAPPIQDYDKPTSAPLEIVKDGVAQYTLVTPKNASAAVMSARTTLVRAIQELTGVSLYRIDDEEAAKTSGNYILLGTTCFDESAAVIESINGERHGSIYL